MKADYDVVIAGAGIAGAVAALLFAKQGLSVLVADHKKDRSRHKTLCTHFVQPLALPILKKLNLDVQIRELGGIPTKAAFLTEVGWIDPPGDYSISDGDGSLLAYNIERRILDPLLMDRLADEPRIAVWYGQSVGSPVRRPDGIWEVTIDQEKGKARCLSTRLLVAADGRQSSIARYLGNAPVFKKENERVCTFGYFENVAPPPGNRSLFLLGEKSMAFLYPLGNERVLLAVYVPKEERIIGEENAKATGLLSVFSDFSDIPDLSRARLVSKLFGYSDYPNLLREPVFAGAAFIGDAAASLDPMSGVGCAFAMLTADMLVDSVAKDLKTSGAVVADGLKQYASSFQDFVPAHAVGIAADSIIARSATTTRAVYRRIVDKPALQRAFIALTGRLITPSEFQRAYLAAGIADLQRPA